MLLIVVTTLTTVTRSLFFVKSDFDVCFIWNDRLFCLLRHYIIFSMCNNSSSYAPLLLPEGVVTQILSHLLLKDTWSWQIRRKILWFICLLTCFFSYWSIVYWFSLCTDLVLYLWLMCFRLVFLDLIASQALLFWVIHTSLTCSLDYILDLFVADLNKLQLASSSPSQNTSLTRNPDDVNQLQAFFTHQGEVLVAYYKQLTALQTANTHLLQALCALPAGRPEPLKIAMGEKFDRSAIAVADFSGSAMCILHTNLRHTERTAPNVPSFSHLDWASAVWHSNEQVQGSYKYCTQLNKDAFEYYYSCVRNQVQQ